MPGLDKRKIMILINSSRLSREEMIRLGILSENKSIMNVTLDDKEFAVYNRYCFEKDIKKSTLSRKLLEEAIENPSKVLGKILDKPEKRRSHSFLVPENFHEKLKKVLKEQEGKESFQILSESEFVRRCIVLFLEKQEEPK